MELEELETPITAAAAAGGPVRGPARHRGSAPPRPAGFSLAEAMLAVLIVSTLLTASLHMLGAAATARRVHEDRSKAAALARDLLAEVMRHKYKDPKDTVFGPEGGETRPTFDDVDDYDKYQETSACTKAGAALPGGTGWKRKVTVDWCDPAEPSTKLNAESQLKRVTVDVISPTGQKSTLIGLRAANGQTDKTLTNPVTYVSRVSVTVRIGGDADTASAQSVNTLNQVP